MKDFYYFFKNIYTFWFINIPAMTPRARKYGVRYYWDKKFRRSIKNREDGQYRRETRGAGFLSRVKKVKNHIIAQTGPYCNWCHNKFQSNQLTVDHIIKVVDGGSNYYSNLQLLCVPCHNLKDHERPKSVVF